MDYAHAGALLREIARLHLQSQRNTLACCGPTNASECQLLTELGRGGAVTLNELARRLDVDKGWVSRVAEGLAQQGLLEKVPGLIDRRTVHIALTDAGRKRYDELNDALNDHAAQLFSRITPEHQPAVLSALEMLRAALSGQECCTPQNCCTPQIVKLEEE